MWWLNNFLFIYTLNLKCCLTHTINIVCCSIKTTNKTGPNKLTNTCISWHDIEASGNYWSDKGAWHPVLLQPKIPARFGTRHNSFRYVWLVLSHDIARCVVVLVHMKRSLETFVSVGPWLCPVRRIWWRHYNIRTDILRSRYIFNFYRIIWV